MCRKIRIAGTVPESIVDGPGIRFVVFTQGCPHHCCECQNPKTWDYNSGTLISTDELYNQIKSNKRISKVTISGGEPFEQTEAVIELLRNLRADKYHIMVYTGYTYDNINKDKVRRSLLPYIDLLVDGEFVKEEKSLDLQFRGSKNQRIIDVQRSLREHKVVIDERYI